ncbi:MAG: DUF4872 domain-containing protein [Phycisphaeraceae bacterium]
MPLLPGYNHFGGIHWETAALKNALAYAGVTAPHTGKPLSEAMCLGVASGIAAGYQFCPSIPSWEKKLGPPPLELPKDCSLEDQYMLGYRCGSGISIVSRFHAFSTHADKYEVPLKRLGCRTTVKETAGLKAAQQHLVDALAAGKPALLWCSSMKLTWLGWAGTCGMYSTLCCGLDEAKGLAYMSDRGPTPMELTLDELTFTRNRVCSLKNRLLTFDPPAKLDEKTLAKAALEGIRACAGDFIKPKLSTFNLPGLLDGSKLIANPKNKRGWPTVFGGKGGKLGGTEGGRIYLPLRDMFDAIETAGTGGGLMRPLYADFLNEAAALTGGKGLAACAEQYRNLAKAWTALAEACLPDRVKPFKQTKSLLRKREKTLREKGGKAMKQIDQCGMDLHAIEMDMRKELPFDDAQARELLESIGQRMAELHAMETNTAKALAAAAR